MKLADRKFLRRMATTFLPVALIATGLFATGVQAGSTPTSKAAAAAASIPFVPDYSKAPYTGMPISPGLGPTYSDPWCANAAGGSSIANQQGAPLALIPQEAFGCTLQKFKTEAVNNGLTGAALNRLDFGVNTVTDAGRDQFWAVVNAMETPEQIEGYNNYVEYRSKALIDPLAAQSFLASHPNTKIAIFMENNIHGDEEEGADSMMQAIRDLTTLPRGANATVDNFLDKAILITIPSMNPDGRFLGQRANQNGFDMNRDWLVQSQPEVRANLALQVKWLAPVMFATHGYVNPTLVDGLTKPHNPGLEYDVFAYWNQRRLDVNQAALARIGQGITRPVNGPIAVTVPDKQTPITAATSSGTTATLTTNGAHGQTAGKTIVVSGVAEAGYNGTFTVVSAPTTTTLTYTTSGAGLPASSGGTVSGEFTTINRGNCSNGSTPNSAGNICGTGGIVAGNGLHQVGNTVTVTTPVIVAAPPHVADTVIISGAGVAGYNGGPFKVTSILNPNQFTYEAPISGLADSGGNSYLIAASPDGLSKSGTTVTVTTTTASNVVAGNSVVIANALVNGYNGTCTAAVIVNATKFTCTAANGNAQVASGGGSISVGAAVGTVQVEVGPGQAEGWDDLGPFYTQTYGAFWGVDGSTMEMCSSCVAPFTGRLGSKTAQYVGFWSSADFWIANREQILADQMKIFVRGVTEAPRPNCCDDPLVASRGFTEAEHDWMTEYPKAYIIPKGDAHQRSDAEANRLAQWVLDNGILLKQATSAFSWNGQTYPAGSYVVMMNQPLRGLAFTALGPGLDYSFRINQLYAPPGGWSHGLMWGADTVEVPNGAAFNPASTFITSVSPLSGGVAAGAADWYAVKLAGVRDEQTILNLLRSGVYGEIAEASFVANGGPMPSGSIIFPADPNTKAALQAAGAAGGLTFQPGTGAKPSARTRLSEAPKVGMLVNSANPAINDSYYSLRRIFGADVSFISVLTGANSLQNSATDPLAGIDVLYNTGQAYPAVANTQARARLQAFFARGGTYIGTSQSATNLSFLTGSGVVGGTWTQASLNSFGGTAAWSNVGGVESPLTAAFPNLDYLYLPSNVTFFTAIPTGAVIDGQYLAEMGSASKPRGPTEGYVAGLWLARDSAAALTSNNAPVVIHGNTTALNPDNGNAPSRYTGLGTNPFSRSDFERIWGWIVQSTLWGNLTDEALLDQTITLDPLTDKVYGDPDFAVIATSTSGRSVSLVAEGDCTIDSPYAPATASITGAGSCTITASQPGDGNFNAAEDVVQTITIGTAELTVTPNPQNPSRQYSDANPAIAPAYDGFVYDDDATDLTTAPTCSTTATAASNVGPYPITCSGGVSDDYTFAYTAGELTVTQENAAIDVSSDSPVYTTGTSATVVLRATVRDSSLIGSFMDSAAGDIRTATVTFKEGSTVLCGPTSAALIGAPLTTGTATCSMTLALGSHAITILVGGNYVATANATVAVTKPASDSHIEGSGAFNVGTSAGSYKADNGSALKFELSATTSPNKSYGQFTYKAGSTTYQVDLTALSVYGKARQTGGTGCASPPSATCSGIVSLRGTAKLSDATSKKLVTIGSNFTVVATMTDRGKTGDSVGFTIWDGATLVFSSDWTGGSTAERTLTSGNVAAP